MRNFIKLIIVSLVIVAGVSAVAVKLRHSSNGPTPQKDRLVVHEWGTFTSIAGKDGVALEWRPLNGPSDLPKFVHSTANLNTGLRHINSKIELTAAVRMETPVIYFYSNRELNVSTKVDFPKGKITEWYPLARAVDNGIDFALGQPIDGKDGNVWPSDPRRLELRPKRHDQQSPEAWYSVHDTTPQFEARWVGPMRILKDYQDWALPCKRF